MGQIRCVTELRCEGQSESLGRCEGGVRSQVRRGSRNRCDVTNGNEKR